MVRDVGASAARKSGAAELQDDVARLAPAATLAMLIGLSLLGWGAVAGVIMMFL